MGLVGAGFGASQSLEEIVAQQLLKQKLAEEIRMQEAALAERRRSSQADEGMRSRSLDLEERGMNQAADERATNRREKNNQLGIRRMMGDFITQKEGPFTAEDQRGIAALQVEAGQVPNIDLPAPPKKYPVTTPGPNGQPLNKLVTEDEMAAGVPAYREPKTGPAPERDQVWVVRNGQITPIRKGTAQPGDKPYDAVGTRQQNAAEAPSPYGAERAARTVQSVDELIKKVGAWTTGYGSILANVPATDARNFKAELDTLKANIAFNELAQMRAASKTGGALGAISDREGQLLESALGALDQGQAPQDLVANLNKVKTTIERWQAAQGAASSGGSPQGVVYVRDPITGRMVKQ